MMSFLLRNKENQYLALVLIMGEGLGHGMCTGVCEYLLAKKKKEKVLSINSFLSWVLWPLKIHI